MIRSDVRWIVAVPDPAGGLQLFRLSPLGAALEFRAPDRAAAERMVVASQAALPDDAVLISRLEFDELQRASSSRQPAPPVRLARALARIPHPEV